MPPSRNCQVARLAGFLTCVALATSRIGLVAHELVGHGGAALALGGSVDEVRLFWFAGGWIHFHLDAPTLAKYFVIAMAGIAVELVAGAAIVYFTRGRIARAVGAALVVHAGWYLATGAWSGFGDGQLLYRVLGDWRYAVAIGAGALTCGAAWFAAKQAFGALSSDRAIWTVVAMVIAAAINVGLAIGEVRLRRDAAYTEVMAPERERIVTRELAAWTATRGSDASAPAIAEQRAKLETAHRTFPFAWLLGVLVAAAAIIGIRRSPIAQTALPIRAAAIAAAISITGVIALSYLL